jgi:hypothetical protein
MQFMATSTKEVEQQSIEEAEGVGKPGTIGSVATHNALLAGGHKACPITIEISDLQRLGSQPNSLPLHSCCIASPGLRFFHHCQKPTVD